VPLNNQLTPIISAPDFLDAVDTDLGILFKEWPLWTFYLYCDMMPESQNGLLLDGASLSAYLWQRATAAEFTQQRGIDYC
jgi:hypothetical protein